MENEITGRLTRAARDLIRDYQGLRAALARAQAAADALDEYLSPGTQSEPDDGPLRFRLFHATRSEFLDEFAAFDAAWGAAILGAAQDYIAANTPPTGESLEGRGNGP